MRIRSYLLAGMLLAAAPLAMAEIFAVTDRSTREVPIFIGGSFLLENVDGDVEVIGTDEPKVVVAISRTIRGSGQEALAEGRQMTQSVFTGDERQRIVRTWVSPMRKRNWVQVVSYVVRVPRTAHVRISTGSGQVKVSDMRGSVGVKNLNGLVTLERLSGPSTVDTANGDIKFTAPIKGLANARLSSVNGNVEVQAPGNAVFQWIAELVRGEVRSNLPVRGSFVGTRYTGSVNSPKGPTIRTESLMGNVYMLKAGTTVASAAVIPREARNNGPGLAVAETFRQPVVEGYLSYKTTIGNVAIGEVRGAAHISTGAGEVQLGRVSGQCDVVSLGGPLNLGEITGVLNARTDAGDVVVEAARSGGVIITGGGMVRLLHAGGPVRVQSGGGDIVVRQAMSGVVAETRSGDINITIDPAARHYKTSARTSRGNVVLNVRSDLAADIDATILTSDVEANKFRSDFPGLTVRRDSIGGKTRIRATGRVNGGGERIELFAEDGGIQILTRPVSGGVSPHF